VAELVLHGVQDLEQRTRIGNARAVATSAAAESVAKNRATSHTLRPAQCWGTTPKP